MTLLQPFMKYFVFLITLFSLTLSQEPVSKPKFPDVFQVELVGIFYEQKMEVDGVMYYDKINNRAKLSYTYQNETTTRIYNFDDSQLISIQGLECTVSDITKESGSFFPYSVDKVTKKKMIAPPEEIFFFSKSVFDRQELSVFPSYVFTAKIDIPQYGLEQCELTHVFSKPEVEMPDCDGHVCRPTLVSLSVRCNTEEDGQSIEIFHIYNFFRFRSTIEDESVFQPPPGVYCNVESHEPFPEFPGYFSFTYDLIDEQKWGSSAGVYEYHKKVWYDAKLRLIRMDEVDDDGLLISSRIFDFYGESAYLIIASEPKCMFSELNENVALDAMTRLPKIFFAKAEEERSNTVFVGKRNVNGMIYDVWTMSSTDPISDAKVVQEFYFSNILDPGIEKSTGHLQISHVNIYTYEKNGPANSYELSLMTHLSISNYRTKPKEWEAFDISPCFSGDQKKGFSLKVDGPPVVKHSYTYESLLSKLHIKLIIITQASLIRISELKGTFDGVNVTKFSGWILNTLNKYKQNNTEPDMEEAYDIIEKAADAGKLVIKMNNTGQMQLYNVTAIFPHVPEPDKKPKDQSTSGCFSGGTVAAVGLVLLLIGFVFSVVAYYVFLKRKTNVSSGDDKVQLTPVLEHS